MKDFLSNIWVKRCVSVFNVTYVAVITLLTYATFLYDLEFVDGMQGSFFALYTLASIFFLVLMIYTKELLLTKILSLILLPVVFFLIVFNMGTWVLIIPPFLIAIVMFFASANDETVKVIMGTIYLLLYVLGLVAYFVLNMLLGGSAVETRIDFDTITGLNPTSNVYNLYKDNFEEISKLTSDDNTISPDGRYQFYLVDVKDSNKGCIKIYVVPYGQDIELKFFTLKQTGIRKTITNKGTRGVLPTVGWTVEADESGKNKLKIQYRLSQEDELKSSGVENMPSKQYLGFLGIS